MEELHSKIALMVRDVLCEALRGAPPEVAARGFVFTGSLMVSAFTGSRRVDALSEGASSGADLDAVVRDLILFLAGGVRALA